MAADQQLLPSVNPSSPLAPAQIRTQDPFDELVVQVDRTIAQSSGRIYRQTYDAWRNWCKQNDLNPLALWPGNVTAFLSSGATTKATRQRQLSALRKLAQMLYLLAPTEDAQRMMVALGMVKAPVDIDAGTEREGHALTPAEADKLLRVWNGSQVRDARNRALVAVLLLTGIRRSEASALRWRDIDFDNGVLSVRHGKGDKAREVPIAGDYALNALRLWQRHVEGRIWVFCPVVKSGEVGKDKPISGTDVYRIVDATGKLADVDWKPHDGRRTFITEALATGTPLAAVQAAAGHAQGATTLRYAQAVDARKARKELRLRYG